MYCDSVGVYCADVDIGDGVVGRCCCIVPVSVLATVSLLNRIVLNRTLYITRRIVMNGWRSPEIFIFASYCIVSYAILLVVL